MKLEKLERPIRASSTAAQCRQMGIKVGDTIYDGEKLAKTKLTLIFIGKTECVWREYGRYPESSRWKSLGEKTSWRLNYRDWFKLPDKPAPSAH